MTQLNATLLPKFTSVSSLRYKTASLIKEMKEDKKPVILLRGSDAVGVIIPPEMYENLVKLAENTEAGKKIPRRLWPKEYIQKYDIKSLWKLNLDSNWRLIYTITGTQAQLFLIYLEYMKHKEYDRKFHYKTS